MSLNSTIKVVVLDDGLQVPIKIVLDKGVRVIRVSNPSITRTASYRYGVMSEDIGTVEAIVPVPKEEAHGRGAIVTVRWDDFGPMDEWEVVLVPYDDFIRAKGNVFTAPPKFAIDQVVYVKPVPNVTPSGAFPMIGSEFEVDVKVLEPRFSKLGSVRAYNVYVPNNGQTQIAEDFLIHANDKMKYKYKDFKEATVHTSLLPFFSLGEKVKIFDNHVYNQDEKVVVKLNDQLKQYLK